MANSNIINAVFGSGICAVTTSAFRANYGMVLRFSGIDLPTAFECDFSNYDTSNNDSITAIGQDNEVQIPDQLWDSGLNIYAYVYLHPTDDSGVTVYTVTIPVLGRPNRTDETPTPHEQSVIEQAISALNDAVEQTAADVETTTANADRAAQSEANASVSERAAAASASAALASQNAAESAAQGATESASASAESARNAANSAAQAAQSATDAQASAEQAEQSAQSISGDVERAEQAATTATGKATEAATSATTANGAAQTATGKAAQAEQSATAAAQSASSASTAAQNAASSATAAESHATDAEQAKQAAQDAQAAAEQAAESVSGLSEQIAQNTADIAELVQSKAGALIDTASGSIASFVPDSTVPTVKGLTVNVEPVQDLHGYDNPWPAGGGKNLLDFGKITVSGTHYGMTFSKGQNEGTVTVTGTLTTSGGAVAPIVYADNSLSGKGYVFLTEHISGNSVVDLSRTYGFRTENERSIAVYLNGTAGQSYTETIRISVYAPPAPTSWTPYSNICPISGWDEVNVQRAGKNLLDKLEYKNLISNYEYIDSSYYCRKIQLTPNTTYTVSFSAQTTSIVILLINKYSHVNERGFVDLRGTSGVASYTTDDEGCLYIGCYYSTTDKFVNNRLDACDIQIELGSTATAYEPYQGDTYTIQLGQTVYGGTLDVTNGVLTVDRAYVLLNDASKWNESSSNTTPYIYNANFSDRKIYSDSYTGLLCSAMPVDSTNQNFTASWSGASSLTFGVRTTSPELSIDVFKNLSSNGELAISYELATPITVDLTPLEISVLTGQTNNIWADSGDVSVEYAADLKTYINNKIAAAVAALS